MSVQAELTRAEIEQPPESPTAPPVPVEEPEPSPDPVTEPEPDPVDDPMPDPPDLPEPDPPPEQDDPASALAPAAS